MKRVSSESDLDALRQQKNPAYVGLKPLVERILDYTSTPSYEIIKQQRDTLAGYIQLVQDEPNIDLYPKGGIYIKTDNNYQEKVLHCCVYCYKVYTNGYLCIHCSICHKKMPYRQRVEDYDTNHNYEYDHLPVGPVLLCQDVYYRYMCHATHIGDCPNTVVCDECAIVKEVCDWRCYVCRDKDETKGNVAHYKRLCPWCYDGLYDADGNSICNGDCMPDCTVCKRK